jgi:hypothetical protein
MEESIVLGKQPHLYHRSSQFYGLNALAYTHELASGIVATYTEPNAVDPSMAPSFHRINYFPRSSTLSLGMSGSCVFGIFGVVLFLRYSQGGYRSLL